MLIAGILLAAVGVATAVLVMVSPGQMQVYSLTLEVAAVLLVGGFLGAGLGGVIAALEQSASHGDDLFQPGVAAEEVASVPSTPAAIPEFGRRAAEDTAAAPPAKEETAASSGGSDFADTIAALEKAKKDITTALGGEEEEPKTAARSATEPEESSEVSPDEADAETVEDAGLYVVEERVIRGRPSRILSDGTVEAETDEGWMRFENLEHLDEYLDAMSPGEKA
jgi:hypothetical protein